uniref:Retrotransposon gag domain-containing protein n=1 Tax=Ananas comosus var. bracteatus TaxID=296719 RepID=A0A6V7QIA8_ANACO|nr:unnamed protein product [Ananas comosus var. bracteatus]
MLGKHQMLKEAIGLTSLQHKCEINEELGCDNTVNNTNIHPTPLWFSCFTTGADSDQGQDSDTNESVENLRRLFELPQDPEEVRRIATRPGLRTRLQIATCERLAVDNPDRLAWQEDTERIEYQNINTEEVVTALSSSRQVDVVFATNMAEEANTTNNEMQVAQRDEDLKQLKGRVQMLCDMVQRLVQQSRPEPSHLEQVGVSATPAVEVQGHARVDLREPQVATTNPMDPEALQKFIDSAVVAKFKQLAQDNEPLLSESDKPYQAWHDLVLFPPGYTRPHFQMFDGTGDPREHLTHFEVACGDTITNGSLLLRQFPLSLKGAAFQWYSKLSPGSIQDWPMMKSQFKSHFVSTKREITLRELADLRQERDEKVEAYITRWKNTSINCSQEIRAEEAIRPCIGGISKTPRSFQSLSQMVVELEGQYSKSPELLAIYKGFLLEIKLRSPAN